MKRLISYLLVLLVCLFLTSCAFAPFGNTYSAQTAGAKNLDLQLGAMVNGPIVPVGRLGYGIQEDTDIGVLSELGYADLIAGLYLKHAMLQKDEGFSLAIETSLGAGAHDSWYTYIGPIVSFKKGWFEPYAIARFNYVRQNLQYTDWLWGDEVQNKIHVKYALFTTGATLWANKHLGFTLSANLATGDYQFGYGALGFVLKTT
jgi:hypothetical protein